MVTRRRLLHAALGASLGLVACATVAGVDVTRPASDSAPARDSDDGAAPNEAATIAEAGSATADDAGEPAAACGCDAGEACCLGASPACVASGAACPSAGLRLGCLEPRDGRECCWNGSGTLASTTFVAGECDPGRAACNDDDDCAVLGGACKTSACHGVIVGVCAAQDAAAPVCP